MNDQEKNIIPVNLVEEPAPKYGFVNVSEDDKLREDIYRSDMEKLQLFVKMLRRNALFDKASIKHVE
jgi:hypothetical protein